MWHIWNQRTSQTTDCQYIMVTNHQNKPSWHNVLALLHNFKVVSIGNKQRQHKKMTCHDIQVSGLFEAIFRGEYQRKSKAKYWYPCCMHSVPQLMDANNGELWTPSTGGGRWPSGKLNSCQTTECWIWEIQYVLYNQFPFYVRFQVLTAASMKLRVFWDVLQCS
jgi:hypothetical protein